MVRSVRTTLPVSILVRSILIVSRWVHIPGALGNGIPDAEYNIMEAPTVSIIRDETVFVKWKAFWGANTYTKSKEEKTRQARYMGHENPDWNG